MTTALLLTEPKLAVESAPSRLSMNARSAWTALALILVLGVPLFLCLPLWVDVMHYDLCVRNYLQGAVPYQDTFDNNWPGILWVQSAIRVVVGWRPEMLRLADLVIVGLACGLLLRWVPREGSARVWTMAALAAFYLSTPERNHCQRDGWMLLPAVIALTLRDLQWRQLADGASGFALALMEGLCWGVAIWIKPFIVAAVLACWLATVICRRQAGVRALVRDALGLLSGGLLAGGFGLLWLRLSGGWDSFWDIQFNWNGEYAAFAYGQLSRGLRLLVFLIDFLPWSLPLIPALLMAVRSLRSAARGGVPEAEGRSSQALLAAFFLAWLFQAACLQHPHYYVLMVSIIPAIPLVASELRIRQSPVLNGAIVVGFLFLAMICTPILRPARLACWASCVTQGTTPELRDQLTLEDAAHVADWPDLARVADFLRAQGLQDGELTCLTSYTDWLYLDLGVRESSPYHQVDMLFYFYPLHVDKIVADMDAHRGRFVVSDLLVPGSYAAYAATAEEEPADPLVVPPRFPPQRPDGFPWRGEKVFQSGRYVVHRICSN